jgi:hypothetical protein
MVSSQLSLLLGYRLSKAERIEKVARLFWTMLNTRLTSKQEQFVDCRSDNCDKNCWVYTAAVIGAKKLRRQMPPPAPMPLDPETNPVVLYCFLHETFHDRFDRWLSISSGRLFFLSVSLPALGRDLPADLSSVPVRVPSAQTAHSW